MELNELAAQAVEKWGTPAQIDMCIEECAELQNALLKYRRGRNSKDNVAEEIADVYIMLFQMTLIFGVELTDKWIDIKELRLKQRLNV